MVGIRFSEWRATLFRAALREFAGPRVAAFQRAALIVSTFSVCVRVLVVTKGEFDFVVRLSQNMEKERERERERAVYPRKTDECLPSSGRKFHCLAATATKCTEIRLMRADNARYRRENPASESSLRFLKIPA